MSAFSQPPFSLESPDRGLSPFTGMTRSHWIAAARHLMEGVFHHVSGVSDPMVFPKVPGKSYPQPGDPEWKIRAMEWEAVVRTLNVAAPLLMEEPDLELNGVPLRAYYRTQLKQFFDPGHPGRLPPLASLEGTVMVQLTCEFGGLCVLLLQYPGLEERLFDQSTLARFHETLIEYAHGRTGPQNWRFFNIMMLTYLRLSGHRIDQELYLDHLNEMMACHAGDGWYWDADAYDNYTPWVYHLYAVLWCRIHGDTHDPERAGIFRAAATEFLRTYPRLFSRSGEMLMWGRSICYRSAAASPMFTVMDLPEAGIDPGWARRIQSGNLLQFLTRPEFFSNGVPSLGFYGPCEAVLQSYSCAASPFWLGLTFGALAYPADHPYWQAVETEGPWAAWGPEPNTLELTGPGLHITNRTGDGTTELRPGKVRRHPGGNYSRLSYHSRLLWEPEDPENGLCAASYTFRALSPETRRSAPLMTFRFGGVREEVLYRQAQAEMQVFFVPPRVDMAEILLPRGVLRVDRIRVCEGAEVRLGHYALPMNASGVKSALGVAHGREVATVNNERGQLALTAVHGWDRVGIVEHEGFSADVDAPRSAVPYAVRTRHNFHRGTAIVVTVLLQRFDGLAWTEDDLQPVASIETGPGEAGVLFANLTLRDGRTVRVSFEAFEDRLS